MTPADAWQEIVKHFKDNRERVDRLFDPPDDVSRFHALVKQLGYSEGLEGVTHEEISAALESDEFVLGIISGVRHARWLKTHGSKGPKTNPFRLHRRE